MVESDPIEPDRCARLLAALAAPERLKIVRFLAAAPHNVTEIAEMLAVPVVNVSHHLAVLKQAEIVHTRRLGRFIIYSLREGMLAAAGSPAALDLGCCRLVLPADAPA